MCKTFYIVYHKSTFQEKWWGFKSKYDFLFQNRTLISSYEDTGTKSMFVTDFGRQMNREINYISIYIEILYIIMKILSIITIIITLFITCCPKNRWICQLDWVYRYIVYNEKTRFWPFYTHFAERKKSYIELFCYNIVENHLYTKFGKKKYIIFLPIFIYVFIM